MDPRRNPYAPGAGAPPPELAGRDEVIERAAIALDRIRDGRAARSFILYGLWGVGKTVLLNRIRLDASRGPFGFCTGDVGVLARIDSAPRLAYGTTRQAGPFRCTSTVAWLTCTNKSGHGFAISRHRWRPVP